MVHGQGDTDHGAANPLPRKDGSSEPPERAWRNPTTRPQGSPSCHGTGEREGSALQPAQAWTHPDDLRSRSPPLPRQPGERLEKLCSPAPHSPHKPQPFWSCTNHRLPAQLLRAGAEPQEHKLMEREGRKALFLLAVLPCCSSGNAHLLPPSLLPRCPFSSSKGKRRGLQRHTKALRAAREHTPQVHHPPANTVTGGKTPVPIHGRLGWACLSARIQPRAKRSTSILLLPPVTGRGSRNSAAANTSLERDGAVGFLLLLIWLLPGLCHSLAHPFKMQSTQQGCAWGWLGRRRLLKTEDSTAGSSGTRREQQQVSSTIPANPQLPQGCFVQLQIPFLSSWMNSLPKAHWICVDKAIYHQHRWVPVKVADQSSDATDFRKNTASLTRQHCDTALPALTVHPRMHPSPVQHPLSSCPNAGTSLRTASEVPFGE